MLEFLWNGGKASERRLRLFAAACVRRVWHLLTVERSRRAVEVAERLADGLASEEERLAAVEAAAPAAEFHYPGASAFNAIADGHRRVMAEASARSASLAVAVEKGIDYFDCQPEQLVEPPAQSAFLRDIIGNPFGAKPHVPEGVLAWDDGTIPKLAAVAYEERSLPSGELDPDRLAVLANALEEVGADPLLLEHLRGPGPHVRGCVVIDMLTGRK